MNTYDGEVVDIFWEEAMMVMDTAQFRLVDIPAEGGFLAYNAPEIFHDGKWKSLCRTDLMDDVATGWCTTQTLEDWVEYYREKLKRRWRAEADGDMPRARYNDRRFSIIDAFSDG